MNIFERQNPEKIDPAREYVLFGRERHTPAHSNHMGGYPMRAIRNADFLYIRNFKPDRWPAGEASSLRGLPYSDIDASPTKTYIIEHRHDPEVARFFDLACAKRPAEELYDIRNDPFELNNLAGDPAYASVMNRLRDQLMDQLQRTGDPRVHGHGDSFDEYPYYGVMESEKSGSQ
jgi:arylsulfatase A-like enzyme